MRTRSMHLQAAWRSLAALCLLAACGDDSRQAQLSSPREASTSASEVKLHVPTRERLGVGSMKPAAAVAAPQSNSGSSGLSWDTPQGWSELAPTSMRVANFRVGGDERAECYLTLLAGDGGGLAANVNRWRTQMSQPPLPASEIAKMPTRPMLGGEAVLVDFGGSFAGMGGGAKLEDARLVGLLLIGPQGAAFLKMTGPASTVGGQLEPFLALAASLRG